MMRYPISLMLKGAADGGLCSAYGAGIGVGNGGVGGSGGGVFICCEGKLPDATPVTFMCVPLARGGFSGQDILAAILFCPGSMTA